MAHHEVDRVRSGHLSRDYEVTLVFTVVVVDKDEHSPIASFIDDCLRSDQDLGVAALDQLLEPSQGVGGRIPVGLTELAEELG